MFSEEFTYAANLQQESLRRQLAGVIRSGCIDVSLKIRQRDMLAKLSNSIPRALKHAEKQPPSQAIISDESGEIGSGKTPGAKRIPSLEELAQHGRIICWKSRKAFGQQR